MVSMEAPGPFEGPLGCYASADWRRFALAAFIADWASYPRDADRADFARMMSLVAVFPAGFRVWMADVGGASLPVGYTGWYPIPAHVFDTLRHKPDVITHRRQIVPLTAMEPGGTSLYLFNYSVVPQLKRTPCSATLLRALADDLRRIAPKGIAAITVSEDGARVARRFGLSHRGEMHSEGEIEQVYTTDVVTAA
jgi:hypothetical protein